MRRVTIPMLRARLETRAREDMWRTYTANRMWELVNALYSGKIEVRAYSEIVGDLDRKAPKKAENAEEIKNRILELLGGERA